MFLSSKDIFRGKTCYNTSPVQNILETRQFVVALLASCCETFTSPCVMFTSSILNVPLTASEFSYLDSQLCLNIHKSFTTRSPLVSVLVMGLFKLTVVPMHTSQIVI